MGHGPSVRANTNPVCPDCDYRTLAIDNTRCACRFCGVIIGVEARVVRQLAVAIGGRVVIER